MKPIKETQRKGYYTDKKIFVPDLEKFVIIGKISGWNGYGIPIYDLLDNHLKVGELNNNFIKKYMKPNFLRNYLKN